MKRLLPLVLAACSSAGTLPSSDGGSDGGTDAGNETPEIVRAHNAVRARAMPAPTPGLDPLTWHTGAAQTAQAHADKCRFEHNTTIMGTYGENIFASTVTGTTPTEVVENWASEEPDYDYTANTCADVCGHYTQIVWRDSKGVGCGTKVCQGNSPFAAGNGTWVFWVCDYAPPGNVNMLRPY